MTSISILRIAADYPGATDRCPVQAGVSAPRQSLPVDSGMAGALGQSLLEVAFGLLASNARETLEKPVQCLT